MQVISSKDNEKIKRLAKLCSSRQERREKGLFVLEGARLCLDALENGVRAKEAYLTREGIKRLGERTALLESRCGALFLLEGNAAAKLSDTKHPQGVFLLCEMDENVLSGPLCTTKGLLALSSLQDPGNVGTILRSADAFGLGGVALSADCPDPFSPKVLRSAMGSVFRVPIQVVDDLPRFLLELRGAGSPVYAAALSDQSVPVLDVPMKGAAIVIGNEGNGLSPEVLAACEKRVIIPISERCESLNAAVAAAVFAWEIGRSSRSVSHASNNQGGTV